MKELKTKLKESLASNIPDYLLQESCYYFGNINFNKIFFDEEKSITFKSILLFEDSFDLIRANNKIKDSSSTILLTKTKKRSTLEYYSNCHLSLEFGIRYKNPKSWPMLLIVGFSNTDDQFYVGKIYCPISSGKKQISIFEISNLSQNELLKNELFMLKKENSKNFNESNLRNLKIFFGNLNNQVNLELKYKGYFGINCEIAHQNFDKFKFKF